jgi:DNA replication protein DnaC
MKRLDEILSKSRSAVSSVEISDTSSATAEAAPACPVCGGAGFVRRELPVDHPRFGRAEPCDCVLSEGEDERRSRLQRLSNLGALTRFTFDSLIPTGRNGDSDGFRAAYDATRAYAADPRGWLVITGSSGSGKTHLAAALANERIAAGEPVLFMVVPDLLDHLRASYDPSDDELRYDQLFEQVRNTPLLVLDDIDAVAGTPWAREKLFQVVNHRYNATLPTVFTTTTRPQQLDDRLGTRMCDETLARIVTLDVPAHGGYQQVGGMARERLAELEFRNFDVRVPGLRPEERESLESAFRAAREFADEPKGWLILQGANGCGKTHLAAAIANKSLASGLSVFFAVVPDLLDHLRASFAPGKEVGYDELFEQVRNVDLLVLDDLGAQASTQWAQEKLYQVVNYRHVQGLPTVVTTDRSNDEIQAAHPRIVARIADPHAGVTVFISAPHYRLGRAPEPAPPGRAPYRRAR